VGTNQDSLRVHLDGDSLFEFELIGTIQPAIINPQNVVCFKIKRFFRSGFSPLDVIVGERQICPSEIRSYVRMDYPLSATW